MTDATQPAAPEAATHIVIPVALAAQIEKLLGQGNAIVTGRTLIALQDQHTKVVADGDVFRAPKAAE